MIHFKFSENDQRYVYLKCDTKQDEVNIGNLIKHINLIDPICYLPTYRGIPYTQDFIWKYVKKDGSKCWYAAIGMTQPIVEFFKANGIEYDGIETHYFKRRMQHSLEEFIEIVDSWNLKYKPRPYQYEVAYKILSYYQSLSIAATRAGKTLISYIVFRYAIEYLGVKKILMIVPSIDLVKQGYNDFSDYAEFFKTECVWGGGKLVESSNLTIGTFQSLIKFLDKKSKKYNPHFYDDYDCVFVDEVHRATAAQTKTIISQPFMKTAKLVFGMTGTLPKEHTIPRYVLHSLLGSKIQEITPKELMDAGYIANVDIRQVRLHYNNVDEQKKLWTRCAEYALSDFMYNKNEKTGRNEKIKLHDGKFLLQNLKKLPSGIQIAKERIYERMGDFAAEESYIEMLKGTIKESTKSNLLQIEKMVVHFMKPRIKYLLEEIIPKCDHNTILFCHHTEYLRYVEQKLKERFPERHIASISGSVGSKKRDEIKQMLKEHNDCILVASYACVGTGLTLSNLCYGILFESFKSEVINMQSIGRGLGLSDMRDTFILYDIIDVFDKNTLSNKLFLQGLAKIKIYQENQYKFRIENVTLD